MFHCPVELTGGALKSHRYRFWQLHAHWGSQDQQGSEHLLDGRAFPAELHFVHYKARSLTHWSAFESTHVFRSPSACE